MLKIILRPVEEMLVRVGCRIANYAAARFADERRRLSDASDYPFTDQERKALSDFTASCIPKN